MRQRLRRGGALYLGLAFLGFVMALFLAAVAGGLVGHADLTALLAAPVVLGVAVWAAIAGGRRLMSHAVESLETMPTKVVERRVSGSRGRTVRWLHMGAIPFEVEAHSLGEGVFSRVREDQVARVYFTRRGRAFLAIEQPIVSGDAPA